jgi:hypothetical protein
MERFRIELAYRRRVVCRRRDHDGRAAIRAGLHHVSAACSGGACAVKEDGVDDGARTHDDRNHNPGLYQLSYVHHCPATHRSPPHQDPPSSRPRSNTFSQATLRLGNHCKQQCLYFFPLPHGQKSLRPTFGEERRIGAACRSLRSSQYL